MRYFAISVFVFIVVTIAGLATSQIHLASNALDIEVQLSIDQEWAANAKRQLIEQLNPDATQPIGYLELPATPAAPGRNHPWVRSWLRTARHPNAVNDVRAHLEAFAQLQPTAEKPGDPIAQRAWLMEYVNRLTRMQVSHMRLSRFLVKEARDTAFNTAVASLASILAVLLIIFWFIYTSQKRHLVNSQNLNQTLELQRQTLLSSQRAMVSITDDEKRANLRAERLANLVEQSSEAIVQLDYFGHVEHYNRASAILFRGLRKLPPDQPFVSLFSQDHEQALSAGITNSLSENKVVAVIPDDQDSEQTIEFTITPVISPGNIARSVSILARDISVHLKEQAQLKLIIENAPNALVVSNEQGAITMANIHAEKLFGYQEGQLLQTLVEELVPDWRDGRAAYLQRPRKAHLGIKQDVWAKRRDDSRFPVEVGLNPIYLGGRLMVVVSIFDLTEQRRQRDEIEAVNQQLERRNEEMEQFVYTVSHDLKSPLFTISGFTQTLKESIENITDDQQKKVNRIQANVERMGQLLDDLLALSRVIRTELERSEVRLDSLMGQLLTTLESSIDEAGATVNVHSPLGSLEVNEGMLFQCAQNLLANAIKYTREGVAPVIDVYTEDTGQSVALHFKDNGTGIDPRHHDRVFQLFQRLDSRDGTGLGLAIVKTIMERHGGRVALKSTPGAGSTFSLIFPKQVAAASTL